MAKIRYFLLAALALIFSACATQTPQITQSKISEDELKLILIKSQNIRFYDFGTLSVEFAESAVDSTKSSTESSADSTESSAFSTDSTAKIPQKIELKVFKLGKILGAFVITQREICYISTQNHADCAPKWMANKSFFGKVSYEHLMEEILLGRDIFDGQGKRLGAQGAVIQEFNFGGEKIYYERSSTRTYFKNFTNGVIVSIEDYKK